MPDPHDAPDRRLLDLQSLPASPASGAEVGSGPLQALGRALQGPGDYLSRAQSTARDIYERALHVFEHVGPGVFEPAIKREIEARLVGFARELEQELLAEQLDREGREHAALVAEIADLRAENRELGDKLGRLVEGARMWKATAIARAPRRKRLRHDEIQALAGNGGNK